MPRSPGELLLTALSGLILGNLDKSARIETRPAEHVVGSFRSFAQIV